MHRSPRWPPAALTALLLLTAGCGHHQPASRAPARATPTQPCPQASDGHGSMGACAPSSITRPGLTQTLKATGPITWPDVSNNDPLTCPQIRAVARAHPLLVVKMNQGSGFVDQTARAQIQCARAVGMATGGYDFVANYTAGEARLFVSLLKADGMTATARGWATPTLDVEYGQANRAGLMAMERVIVAAFGRVQIYTGAWYWTPHLGCWWPSATQAWLAGYPSAPILCGLPRFLYTQHQYTDAGFNGATSTDMSQWLASGSSFAAFTQTTVKPRPPTRHAQLDALYRRRRTLRRVLHAHGCRTTHHSTRQCRVWFAHGNTVNRQIAALHKHGAF